jgi:hypothetical protein
VLLRRPRPFHVGNGDAPKHPFADGVVDGLGAERLHKTVALEPLFVGVHRTRHVDRQHQGEVHLGFRPGVSRQGRSHAERKDQGCHPPGFHKHRDLAPSR